MKNYSSLAQFLSLVFIFTIFLSGCSTPKMAQQLPYDTSNHSQLLSNEESANPLHASIQAEPAAANQLIASTKSEAVAAAAATHHTDMYTQAVTEQTMAVQQELTSEQIAAYANQIKTQQASSKGLKSKLAAVAAKKMLKRIERKSDRLEKKDIKEGKKAKDVNNFTFLIIGLILAIAGLLLVIVGQSTAILILGAGAALAGLVFLLLALL